ncbi:MULTISPECIES: transglutaminase family protein [unclassified Polaromonas]|uniref:transglutaminase family protein n=1 Tax=unclassified Polaromonas TaxID=2638319 RepID=UPI000F085E1A|nr:MULTISPECIES: transglutaminase family protein [unclassified Polaromonas]AYQ29084.1 transglutaminase family protein [Polaromonas sp. SP1]QGJ19796.1 transglutaminase family protein [Polaromonas sp. Pch-P]
MLLHVVHETRYRYAPAVVNAHHVVHLKPANRSGQSLLSYDLRINPAPVQLRETVDVYGNTRSYFSLQTAHESLTVVADSVVSTSVANPLQSEASLSTGRPASPPWEQVRDQFRYRAGAAYDSASEFLFASPYVPRDEAFVEFARPSFLPGRPLPEAARDLMERIHTTMTYESESTEVNTPALEALQQGKGVCQDFAHIMVACCRAMGLPARYVSGYLLTSPPPGQPRLVGSDASHAWASVYCPGLGAWLDFDPTNNRAPGEDYVTLATGRDFLDVSPMRGVIRGGAQHILDVAVTVEPLPAAQAQPGTADH